MLLRQADVRERMFHVARALGGIFRCAGKADDPAQDFKCLVQ
jgi:hypothetical protein